VRIASVVAAEAIAVGDQLLGDDGSKLSGFDVSDVFLTGHGRVQITLAGEKAFETVWFDVGALVPVLRGPGP
jgi:hypothetical protein